MTNQEAVKKLKDIQKLYPWGEDSYKVIDYAIRAVTELPKRRKEAKRWRAKALEQEPSGDVISRQAAIDAMYELCNTGETLKDNPWRDNPHIDAITDAIEELPPVNPQEPLTEEDYIELHDRFGDYVEFVVKDMISGKGERWTRNPYEPQEREEV